ncbi:MAG: FHA domain-containing protein [Actinomycetota bacterium]
MPAVVVKTGPEAGRRIEMGVEVVIGRQDADLVLKDPEVSRRHAVLRRSGESVVIEDLDSTNGTFVKGERIRKPITVGPGDQVRVGRTTLEIEADWRAAETVVMPALQPDQIRSAEARPSGDPVGGHEDATPTQPLPSRMIESALRPARSKRSWFAVGAVVLAVVLAALLGVIAYAGLVDRPAENDFAASANDACATVQRSEGRVDLGRNLTRRELEGARDIRLKALDAIRTLEQPEQDAVLVGRFLSAFGETNASITRLEKAIGSGKRKVAPARRSLRGDVRDERELAAKAGIAGCGGLAIR